MSEVLKSILPDNRLDELFSMGVNTSINASECFIRAGEVPYKLGFVDSGLFRYVYTTDGGDEFTKTIITENNFICSYSAMTLSKPSYFSIEALENSRVVEINWADFRQLMDRDGYWVRFLLKFVEKGFIAKEKRERDLLLLDGETRYKNFLSEFPGLDQRVSQGVIASYLGIRPETLSRIRRKIVF